MSDKRITVWVQRFADRDTLVLQWHDPATGKRKSKSAGTADPDAAEQARADLEYELNHGLHREAANMSWGKFRELFEAEYVAFKRPRTRDNYQGTLDLFESLCNPRGLRSVTERTVSAFAAAMRRHATRGRDGLMASTIRVRLKFLHKALRWAADQKFIPACPKFPTIKVPARKPQPVPTESFERLLAKAPDDQTRAFMLCCWLAGLRRNEALAPEWLQNEEAPWVDLDRNRIWLPATFVKGGEDQWVPLDPALRAALEALPRHGPKVFRFLGRGGRPMSATAVCHMVAGLARAAGVKLTLRSLRRGFGCRYAGKVPAQVLQKLMRHADIKTTMDYYANVDDAVEAAVLGEQRNTQRNTPAQSQEGTDVQAGEKEEVDSTYGDRLGG